MNDNNPPGITSQARLIDRALRDPAFRSELLADPQAVFQRQLGIEVPENIMLEVLEELASSVPLRL